MTDTRLVLVPALALACFTACSGGTGKAQAAPQATATTTAATSAAAPPATAHADAAAPGGTVTGTVAETMRAGGYTYVRLQTVKDDVWLAASEFEVKTGERLSAPLDMPMQD